MVFECLKIAKNPHLGPGLRYFNVVYLFKKLIVKFFHCFFVKTVLHLQETAYSVVFKVYFLQ